MRGDDETLLGDDDRGGRADDEDVAEDDVDVERYCCCSCSLLCEALREGEWSLRTETDDGRCVIGVGAALLLSEEGNGSR